MFKRIFVLAMVMSLAMGALAIAPVKAEGEVCGVDNVTYANAAAAEAAGMDVSYEFACVDPASETGLYEAESEVNFAGQLVEIGSTDVPTTIIVRPNAGGIDVTVNVTADTVLGQRRDQLTELSDWIPGDQIRVIGEKNENTDVVDATILVNLSIKVNAHAAANGWITAIDKTARTITYQWANKEHAFAYDDDTRFVAAGKNPAGVDDLEINDRIRGRLLSRPGATPVAKIVVVLRRGENLFMKIRTFRPNVTLVRLDSTVVPTTIQVRIDATPGLRANDVNNLIGTEGTLVTVNITEITRIVRKYFGITTLAEFSVGDKLQIVGRVNDDGTVDAKLVKNDSIWKTSTNGYPGVVTEVNEAESYLTVNWTPVKYATKSRIREKLQAADNAVTAQALVLRNALKNRIQDKLQATGTVAVGQFERQIRVKQVAIERIRHNNVVLGDLIERRPVRKIKVMITNTTRIVVGTNTNAGISDIKAGDKVRIRGILHAGQNTVTAETIVVVNSLPEIDEPLTTGLNDINEVVSEIVTDDTANSLAGDTTTATEEEVNGDETAGGLTGEGNLSCKTEGESIPVIAEPPVCCAGLALIPPKEENLLGSNGICTALCGNGTCDLATETAYNCPSDCEE